LVTVSDFGNNHGVVMGPVLDGWRELDLCAIVVRTEVAGETVGEATAATMLDGPYGAVRFLLGNLSARGFDLSQGLWVSTGAITGVHPVEPGQKVTAVFGEHGSLSCMISLAQPR
jgi:2-keto-4-pentenoate hydratase